MSLLPITCPLNVERSDWHWLTEQKPLILTLTTTEPTATPAAVPAALRNVEAWPLLFGPDCAGALFALNLNRYTYILYIYTI